MIRFTFLGKRSTPGKLNDRDDDDRQHEADDVHRRRRNCRRYKWMTNALVIAEEATDCRFAVDVEKQDWKRKIFQAFPHEG